MTLPTAGAVFARLRPDIAVAVWPWGAAGNAALAASFASGVKTGDHFDPDRIEHVRALGARALDREPVSVVAVGAIAIVDAAEGRVQSARQALAYGEALSRRDLVIQLMLIETAVLSGNVNVALVHYDRALRTSNAASDMLFPVLLVAADQPVIAPRLARLLSRRPEWWLPFVLRLVQQSKAPAALATILSAENLRLDAPLERQAATAGLARLVALGRIDLAQQLSDRWQPRSGGMLANPRFARRQTFPPFDWALTADDRGGASIENTADGGGALLLPRESDSSAFLARQLVRLPAGRYRLMMYSDGLSAGGSRPTISVTCITGLPVAFAASAATSNRARRDQVLFGIPADCPGEWVTIGMVPAADDAVDPPEVHAVTLVSVFGRHG